MKCRRNGTRVGKRWVSILLLLAIMETVGVAESGCQVAGRCCSDIPILLVEDEHAFRTGLGGMLREDGHDVLEYSEPGRMPPLSLLGHVSLLLSDYEMPGQNGLLLADRFHAAHPNVPIILATGFRGSALEHEVAGRGFLHLVEKPVTYDYIHSLIHELSA